MSMDLVVKGDIMVVNASEPWTRKGYDGGNKQRWHDSHVDHDRTHQSASAVPRRGVGNWFTFIQSVDNDGVFVRLLLV